MPLDLHIHLETGEVHTVEAPPDLKTAEFLADILGSLELRGDWDVFDKDLARDLDPDRTLEDNGVRSGHHLFIKRRERKRVTIPRGTAVPPPPPPPPPRSGLNLSRIAAFLAVPLLVAAGMIGYSLGANRTGANDPPRTDLTVDETAKNRAVKTLEQQKSEAEARLTDATSKLSENEKKALTAEQKVVDLTRQVARLNRDLTTAQARISALEADAQHAARQLTQARTEAEQAKASTETSIKQAMATAAAREKADSATIDRLTRQLVEAGKSQRSGILEWRGRASKGRLIEIVGNTATEGRLTGSLPGVPCRVYVGNPDRMRLRSAPGASNWSRMAFEATENGNATFVFFWTTI